MAGTDDLSARDACRSHPGRRPSVPLPDKVAPAISDRQDFTTPDRVQLNGWVGRGIAGNEVNRLVRIDPAGLLEGDRRLREICLNAWQVIVDKRLYLTGAVSPNLLLVGEPSVSGPLDDQGGKSRDGIRHCGTRERRTRRRRQPRPAPGFLRRITGFRQIKALPASNPLQVQ